MTLSSEERKQRIRDSQSRWRDRNRDKLRELHRQSANANAGRSRKRAGYHKQRQSLIEQGLITARGVGRPCIYATEEERMDARRAQKRASAIRFQEMIAVRRAALLDQPPPSILSSHGA